MRNKYVCLVCEARVFPVNGGREWRHYRAPREKHVAIPSKPGSNKPLIPIEDIMLLGTHPGLYPVKKGIEFAVDIYKKFKDD